jgi:MFS family permease
MIIIQLIGKRAGFRQLVVLGTLLCGLSYALFNVATGMAVLVVAMVLVTFSEIFAMPFMITFTINRAGEKHRGSYIGLYTLAYSVAFILAPYLGTQLVAELRIHYPVVGGRRCIAAHGPGLFRRHAPGTRSRTGEERA